MCMWIVRCTEDRREWHRYRASRQSYCWNIQEDRWDRQVWSWRCSIDRNSVFGCRSWDIPQNWHWDGIRFSRWNRKTRLNRSNSEQSNFGIWCTFLRLGNTAIGRLCMLVLSCNICNCRWCCCKGCIVFVCWGSRVHWLAKRGSWCTDFRRSEVSHCIWDRWFRWSIECSWGWHFRMKDICFPWDRIHRGSWNSWCYYSHCIYHRI